MGIPSSDSKLVLFSMDKHREPDGKAQSVTFWSDDVQATWRVLQSKGVEFAMEPKTEA
jgi:hypothetical protein